MSASAAASGAEALLAGLRAMGVERIFASPGSDWAPVWEALAAPHATAAASPGTYIFSVIVVPR